MCLLVHKSLLGNTPEYISDLLTSVANIPGRSTLRASSCGNLVVPWTRRRIGYRAFSVAARGAWNRLPTELKLLRSMDSFPRDLKTFMFHSVYGTQYKCLSYSYSTTVVDTRSVTDCGHPTYSRAHVYASSVRQILAKRFHFDRRTSKQI